MKGVRHAQQELKRAPATQRARTSGTCVVLDNYAIILEALGRSEQEVLQVREPQGEGLRESMVKPEAWYPRAIMLIMQVVDDLAKIGI